MERKSQPITEELEQALLAEYLQGQITLEALADKHGLHKTRVKTLAAKRGWTRLRDEARTRAGQKLVSKVARAQAKAASQYIERHLSLAETGIDAFAALMQGEQIVVMPTQAGPVQVRLPALNNSKDLKAFADALKTFAAVQRKSLGLDDEGAGSDSLGEAVDLVERRRASEVPDDD